MPTTIVSKNNLSDNLNTGSCLEPMDTPIDSDAKAEPENGGFDSYISVYTRTQAIKDGFLVDVSQMAKEAGFLIPMAVTSTVWGQYIAWEAQDTERQVYQDTTGRLWDVLYMLRMTGKHLKSLTLNSSLTYALRVVPRGGKHRTPKLIRLKAVLSQGDHGEPVLTIMLPGED